MFSLDIKKKLASLGRNSMIINSDTLIPAFRVYSSGKPSTFLGLDEATQFLRAEAAAGSSPLSLLVIKMKHEDYIKEIEAQEEIGQ